MSNALRLPKAFDEITEATLLDEDWYDMRLVKAPIISPNGALKEYMKENSSSAKDINELYEVASQAAEYQNDNGQYAGLNWVLNLRVEHEDPLIRGRSFKVYLGIPIPEDANRVTPLGQTVEDSKMEKIKDHLDAFKSGQLDGASDEAELIPGDMARFYVVQRDNERFGRIENTIDINSKPEPCM